MCVCLHDTQSLHWLLLLYLHTAVAVVLLLPPLIADFKREHFWNWSYFSDYCLFLLLFAGAMGIITMLFSRYPVYLESVGFMAVFTEAMLGIPQFVRNFKNKSTEGMRFVMLLAAVTQCFVCTYL